MDGEGVSAVPRAPATAGGLADSWLAGVVPTEAPAAGVRATAQAGERLGDGFGLLSTLHRVRLTGSDGSGTRHVVVKRPATGGDARTIARSLHLYVNEACFYRDLAAATELAIGCHHVDVDESDHDFVIVLDDLSEGRTVDQIAGCGLADAVAVVDALARHHARHWDEAGLDDVAWLRRLDEPAFVAGLTAAVRVTWPSVRDTCGDVLDRRVVALGDRLADVLPQVMAVLSRRPRTQSHGDVRLDNTFFDGRRVKLCDWQLTDRSRGARDLSYFVTQSIATGDRRRWEHVLLERYLAELARHGVTYDPAEARADFRTASVLGLAYAVVASGGLAEPGTRSAALCRVLVERAALAVLDHGVVETGVTEVTPFTRMV